MEKKPVKQPSLSSAPVADPWTVSKKTFSNCWSQMPSTSRQRQSTEHCIITVK